MTATIQTKSHGNIDGGFFSVYTQGFRLGEYAFPTQHVHNVIGHLAGHPNAYAANLLSFGLETFWRDFSIQIDGLVELLNEQSEWFSEEKDLQEVLDNFIQTSQGTFDPVQLSLMRESMMGIPLRISNNEEEISVGEYKLDKDEFRGLAVYVINGGFLGWGDGIPESAERAKSAIQKSERPLFSGLYKQ